jgi:hypothetical protein
MKNERKKGKVVIRKKRWVVIRKCGENGRRN